MKDPKWKVGDIVYCGSINTILEIVHIGSISHYLCLTIDGLGESLQSESKMHRSDTIWLSNAQIQLAYKEKRAILIATPNRTLMAVIDSNTYIEGTHICEVCQSYPCVCPTLKDIPGVAPIADEDYPDLDH